jgi:uncharacterized protein (DUF2384 family)
MSNQDAALHVAAEARKILGDHADAWMQRPSKLLAGMAPADLARSKDGARVVLLELERAKTPLKAAVRTRRV